MNLTFKSRFTFLLTIQLLNISSRAQGAESRGRTKYLDGPERLAGLPAAPHLLLVALGRLPVTDALPLRDEDARQSSSLFLLLLLGSSVPTPREPSNSADLSQSGGEETVQKREHIHRRGKQQEKRCTQCKSKPTFRIPSPSKNLLFSPVNHRL